MAGRSRLRLVAMLVLLTSPGGAGAEVIDKRTLLRVLLTTDARQVASCERVGTTSDTSLEDLRRKIVRSGGDTGLMTFDADDPERVNAEVYRCQKLPTPAVTAPPGVPGSAAGPASALGALSGTWAGTLTGPFVLGSRPQFPATVRVWDEGGQMRWRMDVSGADYGGSGTVTETYGDITFTGVGGRLRGPISYTLTLKGQTLEGTGVGADNIVRTLSLRKQD